MKIEVHGEEQLTSSYGSVSPSASPSVSNTRTETKLGVAQSLGLILLSSCLAASMSLCIAASKVGGTERYVFVTVTLLSECTKGTIALSAYYTFRGAETGSILGLLFSYEGLYYAVPAFLYMVDNNLGFVILRYIDPATQSLLWNIKIVQTALLFRFVLGRRLTLLKWLCIGLLFCGIVGSQSAKIHGKASSGSLAPWDAIKSYLVGVGLVILGTSITSLAGIYTEWVLKRNSQINFFKQQVLLYFFGSLFNSIVLFCGYKDQIMRRGFFDGYDSYAFVVILLMAFNGIATATIFKYLDNIMNVYTQAGCMLITAIVATAIGTFIPTVGFVCGACVCLLSMYIYNCPVEVLLSGGSQDYYEQLGPACVITSSSVKGLTAQAAVEEGEEGAMLGKADGADSDGKCRYRISRAPQSTRKTEE
jgi:UDP-sugar transporter A1/2/3